MKVTLTTQSSGERFQYTSSELETQFPFNCPGFYVHQDDLMAVAVGAHTVTFLQFGQAAYPVSVNMPLDPATCVYRRDTQEEEVYLASVYAFSGEELMQFLYSRSFGFVRLIYLHEDLDLKLKEVNGKKIGPAIPSPFKIF